MKKVTVLILGALMFAGSMAIAADAEKKIDYFEEWAKDNPALAEELVIIYKDHPGWRGAIWGDEVKMKWVLDNAEKHPMAAFVLMEYADNHPELTKWCWEHPVWAKHALIYAAAHKRAVFFAAKHPGMAKWVKNHPAKAGWIKNHPVAAKKVIKQKVKGKR